MLEIKEIQEWLDFLKGTKNKVAIKEFSFEKFRVELVVKDKDVFIHEIEVFEKYQNQKVFTEFMYALEENLKWLHFKRLFIWLPSSAIVRAWCEKRNWIKESKVKGFPIYYLKELS